MKTFILSLFVMLASIVAVGQSYQIGPVTLSAGYTAEFNVNVPGDEVTLTLIGPDGVYLGLGIGIPANPGMGMSVYADMDVITVNDTGIQDRNYGAFNGLPPTDVQDWILDSNTTAGGVRTMIARRPLNTGDAEDFVFPTTAPGTFPLIWALGATLSYTYHSGGRGYATANVILDTEDFEIAKFRFAPNPASTNLNIELPQTIDNAEAIVYNYMGAEVLRVSVDQFDDQVNIATLSPGAYLLALNSDGRRSAKAFVKR